LRRCAADLPAPSTQQRLLSPVAGQAAPMAASKVIWKVLALGSGLVAARAAGSLLDKGWRRAGRGAPPRNPSTPETGTAIAVSRMLAQQGAARAWEKTTGSLPPGVSDVGA